MYIFKGYQTVACIHSHEAPIICAGIPKVNESETVEAVIGEEVSLQQEPPAKQLDEDNEEVVKLEEEADQLDKGKEEAAATRIQAAYRGHCVRKSVKEIEPEKVTEAKTETDESTVKEQKQENGISGDDKGEQNS